MEPWMMLAKGHRFRYRALMLCRRIHDFFEDLCGAIRAAL